MKINDNRQKDNVVNRILGTGDGLTPISLAEKDNDRESSYVVYDVPIDDITPRPVNEYIISDIDELMASIEKVGMRYPIEIRINPDADSEYKYMLVDGERRFTANKRLREKYQASGNVLLAKFYSTIHAHILSRDECANEEQIHRDANEKIRVISNLERVLNYDPKGIDFEKEETRLQMVNDVYGPEKIADYKSGKLKLRFNISDKAKWIRTMIVQKNPNIELSDSSVRRYIVYLDSVTPELMAYTMGDKISLRDSMVLSTLPAKDQNEAVAACGTPKFKVLLAQAKKLGREGNKKDGISMEGIPPVSPEESIQMANDMVMLGKKLVGISEAYEKFSDKLLGAELTRDQTIVMKKMNDVMRAIEKLKHSV